MLRILQTRIVACTIATNGAQLTKPLCKLPTCTEAALANCTLHSALGALRAAMLQVAPLSQRYC